jgi:hypothetical protein
MMTMPGRKGRTTVALGGLTVIAAALAACSAAPAPGSAVIADTQPSPPTLVTAKPVAGAPGKGPTVITSPVPLPGGAVSSQKVALSDRTLLISSVTTRTAAIHGSVLIDLRLAVQNISGKAISNRAAFFELIGPGGDTFGYQGKSTGGLFGAIGAHASRSGMIEFQIPSAAASGLYLLYRPEIAAEAVLTRLKAA